MVSQVVERIEIYRQAIQQAEAAGESSKVRRYKRSMTPLEQVGKGLYYRNDRTEKIGFN